MVMPKNNNPELTRVLTEAKNYIDKVVDLVDRNGMMAIMSKRSVYYKEGKRIGKEANTALDNFVTPKNKSNGNRKRKGNN